MSVPPLKPIPLNSRQPFLFLKYGRIDVQDNAFVLTDEKGIRLLVPVGAVACLMLEPGTTITHAAIVLAAKVGTLLYWVGADGVRLYSAGLPGGTRSDKLIFQTKILLDESARQRVISKMFEIRFGKPPPKNRSVEQLRGIEGARVRSIYAQLAEKYEVPWNGRNYNTANWGAADPINRAISCATSCLYGITEAAVLTSGYSPAIGFLHSGKPLAFVYDIADLIKFETVVPSAFEVVGKSKGEKFEERAVRIACREAFRRNKTIDKLFGLITEVLSASKLAMPEDIGQDSIQYNQLKEGAIIYQRDISEALK